MIDPSPVAAEPLVVGLSISEPSANELVALGLSEMHVRHAFIEVVRHVLARGWSIAYGGDLRAAGYTEALFDLVRTYDRSDLMGPERVFSYLAWPIWPQLTPDQRADLANVATIREAPPPEGAPETLLPPSDRPAQELLWNSLALTEMRQLMTSQIGARVVLGGRVSGQQGLIPGVTEEAALALRSAVPLYVAGGFGGCARQVAAAIAGDTPTDLTLDYQVERTPRYPELLDAATSANRAPSFDDLLETFARAGEAGLRNGLDAAENRRLFVTDDVDEVVALVLRGLTHVTNAA